MIDPHSAQNILKRQRIRRWLDAGKFILLQDTHWETSDLTVWDNLFLAATTIASEAVDGAGGVAILTPPSAEIIHKRILAPGYAVMAELRYKEQPIRVLSWYLPPGRRDEVMPLISQAMPTHGPPLFAGGDLNYNVPDPTPEEHDRAQSVRGFLAQRSSMCVEFHGPTHKSSEQGERSTRQLDALAVPATAIWKWAVTPCWTDGQSDHAASIASLHRRRAADNGALSAHLIKNIPPVALADLRSRFGLLERLANIPRRPCEPVHYPDTYGRQRGPGVPPVDSYHANLGGADLCDTRPPPVHNNEHPRGREASCPDRDNCQPPPFRPGLEHNRRVAMEAMIQGWWRTWRRHKPASVGALLQDIGQGGAAIRPTGVLRDWLQAQGWQGEWPQVVEAKRWTLVWVQEQAQERASNFAPWASGPSSKRTPLADHFRIGRSMFGRLHPIHGVRDEHGRLRTDPREMDDILWRSREPVWATTPPAPECGDSILNSYSNRPRLNGIETPTWDRLTSVVMEPAGSAPRHDGIPYEVFHHGSAFVACLLGQAFYAAQVSNADIEKVLGPSIDILVWILKNKGGERPTDMRPLQLPTCFRRLFGAALASVVGPAVEPHMCDDQAAKAGGSCGRTFFELIST